jgi:hypothetical protein
MIQYLNQASYYENNNESRELQFMSGDCTVPRNVTFSGLR